MPNPVYSLIPWTGGLNRHQHPSLGHPTQLVEADDIVFGFDGSRNKRGGQSHRNRVRIPGGGFDDHFTASPPGDWTLTGSSISQPAASQWQIITSSEDLTLTRAKTTDFTALLTMEIRLKWVSLDPTGYVEFYADTGATGAKRLAIQFHGDGVKVYVTNSAALVSTVGTFLDLQFTQNMKELYDTAVFHTWTVVLTATSQVEIAFDGHLLYRSNVVTNTLSSGAGVVKMTVDFVSSVTDFTLDYISVYDAGVAESVVTAIYDFPRPAASGLETVHRMITVVNGRVYEDPGTHQFGLVLEKSNGIDPRTLFSFAAFKGNLLIGRSGGWLIQRWIPGGAITPIPDCPRVAFLRVHRNRVFGGGDRDHPSRLYWSGLLNDDDWTLERSGTFLDSGFEDVDPDDGGILTGIGPSFHGELIIYKTTGIYRLEGSDNSNFSMSEITKAIGGIGHHAIANVGNDQYFISPFGVHSLLTTDKFGAYDAAFLSYDIRDFWKRRVNPDQLVRAWAANNEREDRYDLMVPVDEPHAGFFPSQVLTLHYGIKDELHPVGRWSKKLIAGGSIATFKDEDGKNRVFIGSTDGYVNRQDESFCHDFPVYYANPAL